MIADLPCIISGDVFAVLDPHKVNINCKDDEGVPLTGTEISVADLCCSSSLSSCYNGLFGFEVPLDDDYFDGTIFRFPLRSPQANSKLTETAYSSEKVLQNLFYSLSEEASMLLLFLKNLTNISLYNYNQKIGEPELLLDISIDPNSVLQVQTERRRCIDLAKEWQRRQNNVNRLYSLTINVKDVFEGGTPLITKSFYLVLNCIGTNDKEINEKSEQLKVIPWVGIAAPCSFSTAVENCEMGVSGNVESLNFKLNEVDWRYTDPVVSGHAFCFLPMPNPTGLPVSINGYFSIADNRCSIKWPTHDEHGKGADFNKELVMKMVSYAYATIITCRCQLVSYVNTPSYLSTELSDAYSIWPLLSQVKNHPIWSCLVEPVITFLTEQKVVWTAAGGGKWLKFSDAYYQPEELSIPNAVIDLLLEIKVPFVILPTVILDSVKTVHSLAEIIKSKEITPGSLQKILKQLKFIPKTILDQVKCIELLSFVLSDFSSDINIDCLLGINIIPLMNKAAVPKQLSRKRNAKMLYILVNDECISFLPGLGNCIITNNLSKAMITKMKQLSQISNVNIKLADDEVVCKELLPLSLQQWQSGLSQQFSWFPGQKNHPPFEWIFNLWKWFTLANLDLSLVWNYAIVPQERLNSSKQRVEVVRLLSLSYCQVASLTLGTNASSIENKVADLLKTLDVIIIERSAEVFQNSHLYDNLTALTPRSVITLLTNSKQMLRINEVEQWKDNDKQIFFEYLSSPGETFIFSPQEIKLVKDLPIFRVGVGKAKYANLHNRNYFIVQQLFGLMIDSVNVIYPDNVFYCTVKETDFLISLNCIELSFYKYCVTVFLPYSAIKNATQKKMNYQWILSCASLWCEDLTQHLQTVPLVATANALRMVKPNSLYDPEEPAVSQLFTKSEDELPSHEYQQFLPQLRRLGLITWNMIVNNSQMYEQLLLNRAQSVRTVLNRNDKEFAIKRSLAVVTYLVDYFNRGNFSQNFKRKIESIKFLFCASKPTPGYPTGLQWDGLNGSNNAFAPNELYCNDNRLALLVGGTGKVLSNEYFNFIYCKKFQDLFKVPDILTVINQLNLLIYNEPTSTFSTSVYAIYDYFSDNLNKFKTSKHRLDSRWIWVNHQKCFEDVSKFAMQPFDGKQLEPFCYAITHSPQLLQYKQLFYSCGIPNTFPKNIMLNVISHLQKCTSQMITTYLDVVFATLDWVRDSGEVPHNILIPTNECQLLPPGKCIFDDRGWSQKRSISGYSYTHRRLPLDTATFFGVKLLSQHLLPSVNLALQYSLTGPRQSITGRIKEALEDYDQDIDVFKEMIQNAEDAGASEIKFVIDWRNHPTEHLLTKEMELLQGPALLVYNNAVFSDEDFTNICNIAAASKKIDPTKIGRFGVGFCSVYHITDVPSFVSRNYYTVFDPNLLYLQERITSANPGMQIDFETSAAENLKEFEDQFTPFCDLFHCDVFGKEKNFNGTLFRFPFRTEQMARKSKISKEVYLKERIVKVVKMVCNEASAMLMFLHNIKSISLYELKQQSAMECLLHVEREQMQPKIVPLIQLFKCNFRQNVLPTTDCQVRKFFIKFVNSVNYWMVTSCLGEGKSLEISRSSEGRKKGLCPFGEIAIKLDPILLYPCKSVGNLFCFMPVPILSHYNFLINGYFDISRDRRSLKKDAHGILTKWNFVLIKDAISKCFLQMLLNLDLTKAMKVDPIKCLESYYSIWPHEVDKQGSDFNQILYNSIRELLLETDAKLLWSYDKWVCPKIAYIYLNIAPILPNDRKNEIVLLMLKYGYPMVDIPPNVEALLSPKTVTYEVFCKEILFEYLDEIDNEIRDNQIIQLLVQCTNRNGWQFRLLTTKECIPTKPNGTLKKPKDLVDPNSSLAELYAEEDECFPLGKFCESNTLSFLRICGMTVSQLSTEQLKERATTVSNLQHDKAHNRSQNVIKYITIHFNKYNSSSIVNELKDIEFLPVMKCPEDVTLSWFNTIALFEAPSKMYSKQYQNLLFTQELVHRPFDYYDNILEILQQNKNPTLPQVLEHFKCLIYNWQNHKINNEATIKLTGESCKAVYEYLQNTNAIAKYKQCEAELQQLKNEIDTLPFVWHDNQFLSADNAVLKWDYVPYSDLLCDLSKNTENKRFEHLFKLLGIRESPTVSQCMSILDRLHARMNDSPLLSDAIEFCSGIAKYLASHLSIGDVNRENQNSELLQKLYLPDESCIMRYYKDLAFKESIQHSSLDNSNLLKTHFKRGTYWLHKGFTGHIARSLGIPSALESILGKIIDNNFLGGSDYGQHEDLCDRINSLLEKYPNDIAIFKEFIQNAEDAGASEIAFIIDQREFSAEDGELFSDSENWSRLHKLPSLLVYNNKTMTEDDLIGITKLGRGNKRDSLESIGRFGVGFNVAYHITDCPMYLSYGPGGVPENFCVLDPTCQYAPFATKASPGKRWKLSDEAYVEQFNKQLLPLGIKKFHEFQNFSSECMIELSKNENGCVVFRLPLTKQTPGHSKISPKSTMSAQKLKSLFKNLANDAQKLPLFIKNLKCISAFEISKDGVCSHYFTTSISMNKESVTCKSEFSKKVKLVCKESNNNEELKFSPCNVLYKKYVKTTITPKCIDARMTKSENIIIKEQWLISEQFGSLEIPREMMIAGFSSSLTPLGGVAILLQSNNYSQEYNIFCSLPLPLKSYLPLHVNGHFWVDDSRKHLETGAVESQLSKWNKCLTTTVITSAYLAAIEEFRKYIDINNDSDTKWYYSLFPFNCLMINADSKLHSFGLIKCMYASMIASNSTVLQKQSKSKGLRNALEWLSIKQACFLSDKYRSDKSNELLSNVILAFNLNLTNAPIEIYYHIKFNQLDCPNLITPEYLINVLKSIKDINFFADLIKCNIKVLLNYCLLVSKENDDKITADAKSESKPSSKDQVANKKVYKIEMMTAIFTDVPLLLTQDGFLRKFNLNKPVYCSNYARYFSHRKEDFIDQKLEECEIDLLRECGFIQVPTINYLAQHTTVLSSTEPVLLSDVPDIENFWTCLHQITSSMLFVEIPSQQLSTTFTSKPIILGSDKKLYPLCKAKMVLESHSASPALSVMIQLGYPVLNTDHKVALDLSCTSLFSSLIASSLKGDDVVECIHLHQKTFVEFDTSCFSDSEEDLRRFISTLSSSPLINRRNSNHVYAICKLPIFKTFNKKFESLKYDKILLPNEYNMIPIGGLETVVYHSSKQILIPDGIYGQIYKCLNFTSPSLEEFYTEFIFGHIIHMAKEDIFQHIDLLRRKHCIAEKAPVSLALQCVQFMEHKTVSEYYDPEIVVFKTFLPLDAFPPSPWNNDTWLPVLRILGLQKLVTGKKLIEFAKIVENASYMLSDITCTIQKAKILLNAIGERMCNKKHPEPLNFCEELSTINFIPIFINTNLKVLLKKFTKEDVSEYFEYKFIPFKRAIIPHHQGIYYHQISFTSNTVIDWSLENLQCSKLDQDVIAQILHLSVQPSCATVVDNLLKLSKMVTSVSMQSARQFFRRSESVNELQNLFDAHYQFLENHCNRNSDAIILQLQNENFIFVCKEDSTFSMVQCTKIVKFITTDSETDLSPYLFKMPIYFSRYISLIKLFNIQEKPTSLHFAEILKELYFQFFQSDLLLKDSYLCLAQAEKAFSQLLQLLKEEDDNPCQQEYYLLDEDDSLHPQSRLVYNDAPWYQSRLKKGYYHFMKPPKQEQKGNFCLPECLQVRLLSSLVTEEISDCTFIEDNECMQERLARQSPGPSNGCDYVIALKLIIKSPQFKAGLQRIIHHQTGKAPSQRDEATINILDNLVFKCYHKIETVLNDTAKNQPIPDSRMDVFCAMHNKTEMCIAPHTSKLDEVVNTISLKLNSCLNNMVHNDLHIVQMIKCGKPEDIKEKLDQLHIKPYDKGKCSSKTVGDLLKKVPNHSDQVVFENFCKKERVIYWNSEGKGILATIQSGEGDDDVIFNKSIKLMVNDNKETDDTTLFCVSKLLNPSQIESLNLEGQQTEQAVSGDLLLYDIPHECEDEAITWINGVVEYCDTLTPQQHYFVLERLKFYAYYYLVICNQAQHIYDTISNILDSAIYKINSLLQNLNNRIQGHGNDISQFRTTRFSCSPFGQSRSSFIRPRGATRGYHRGPSGGYRFNPIAGVPIGTWGPPTVVEERPQVNFQEAYIWYHQASADYQACEHLIESTTTSSMPGGFKCQHCALICFLSHEIVDLCLKALCYAFVGLNNNLKGAGNILMFYKELTKSSQCPTLDIEQCVHQVSEYDRSTRFPDAHVPSEPPCCVYDETDAYNAFVAAQKVFKCAGQKLSSADSQGIMTLSVISLKGIY